MTIHLLPRQFHSASDPVIRLAVHVARETGAQPEEVAAVLRGAKIDCAEINPARVVDVFRTAMDIKRSGGTIAPRREAFYHKKNRPRNQIRTYNA